MDNCANHPELEAIEQCEVCRQNLCGICLWYGEHGHRYCETHAQEAKLQGEQIYSPQTYAEGVEQSLVPSRTADRSGESGIPYKGNSQDLYGAIAAAIGVITLLSCFGGIYCLPFLGGILGAVAFFNADKSIDPRRTKLLGGIGMGVGGLLTILLIVIFALYGAIFFAAFSSAIP